MIEKVPTLYQKEEDCCGCTACFSICPKNAIYMVKCNDGFEYPRIDEKKCVGCNKCIKVCPFK